MLTPLNKISTPPSLPPLLGQTPKASATGPTSPSTQDKAPVLGSGPATKSAPPPAPAKAAEVPAGPDSGVRFAFSEAAMAATQQASTSASASQTETTAAQSPNAPAAATNSAEEAPEQEIIKPLAGPALPLPAPVAGVTEVVEVSEPAASDVTTTESESPATGTTGSDTPTAATSTAPASTEPVAGPTASGPAVSTSSAPAQTAPASTSASVAPAETTSDEEQARAAAIAEQNRGKLIGMVEQLRSDPGTAKTSLTVKADDTSTTAASPRLSIAA